MEGVIWNVVPHCCQLVPKVSRWCSHPIVKV